MHELLCNWPGWSKQLLCSSKRLGFFKKPLRALIFLAMAMIKTSSCGLVGNNGNFGWQNFDCGQREREKNRSINYAFGICLVVLKCLDCVQIPKGQQEKAIFT